MRNRLCGYTAIPILATTGEICTKMRIKLKLRAQWCLANKREKKIFGRLKSSLLYGGVRWSEQCEDLKSNKYEFL